MGVGVCVQGFCFNCDKFPYPHTHAAFEALDTLRERACSAQSQFVWWWTIRLCNGLGDGLMLMAIPSYVSLGEAPFHYHPSSSFRWYHHSLESAEEGTLSRVCLPKCSDPTLTNCPVWELSCHCHQTTGLGSNLHVCVVMQTAVDKHRDHKKQQYTMTTCYATPGRGHETSRQHPHQRQGPLSR